MPNPSPNRIGGWRCIERLGAGGNGEVYRAEKAGEVVAIKLLRPSRWQGITYQRFKDEINVVRRCTDIPGLLPVLEFSCPDAPTRSNPPWFAMPVAEPIGDVVGSQLREVVAAMAEVAQTLAVLHSRGISHRDVKKENLFRYHGQFVLGDFGVADYPDKAAITLERERIGPAFYIAPEMLNGAGKADGTKADVYSFAKTLWVLATGQNHPLPGEMSRQTEALRLSTYSQDPRAAQLNSLIESCTRTSAADRPDMRQVATELRSWLSPVAPSLESSPLDLSSVADIVRSLNLKQHQATESQYAAQEKIRQRGIRIRSRFHPALNEIREALVSAGFSVGSLSIENYNYGFELSATVARNVLPGEVDLRIKGLINPENDLMRVMVQYTATAYGHSIIELWKDECEFLEGGTGEEIAIEQLISGLRANLATCAARVTAMAMAESDDD